MTKRRKLLCALGAALFALPSVAFSQQQAKVWRIGCLVQSHGTDIPQSGSWKEFTRGMRELGYVEGKNIVIEWRFADGQYERLPGLAAELVKMKVDVIVVPGTPATSAAQKATTTIPIVMANIADPVGSGFVKSLARPGTNITGLSNLTGDLASKHLEMLLNTIPALSRVAVLINPDTSSHVAALKNIQAAAQKSKVTILPAEARTAQEIEKSFSSIKRQNAGAVIVIADPVFGAQRHQIVELAAKNRLPTMGPFRSYAEAGFLMSYGQNSQDNYRRAAVFVDRIIKGANPADIPVEQPTKLELVINVKTAKALGIAIPQSVLLQASRVIE